MKVTLRSTTKLVTLKAKFGGELPARIWEGETDSGIPVHAYITRIAVKDGLDDSEFKRDLQEHAAPSAAIEAIPLRLII